MTSNMIDARIKELNETIARLTARVVEQKELTTLSPESEYHEDMGDVLWWKVPITEAPWVGSPNCLGQEVLIIASVHTVQGELIPYKGDQQQRVHVGGWPGYHTHFSPLPKVTEP